MTNRVTTINLIQPHPLNAELYGDGCDQELLESIRKFGILTPLLVTKGNNGSFLVVSGHRRLNACQMLGITNIPITFIDFQDDLSLQEALIVANKQRQKSNEQIAREYAKIKEIEEERAKVRQGERKDLEKNNIPDNCPECGDSREIAAKKLGINYKKAEKAEKVVQKVDALKAEGKEEEAEQLRTQLNTKSVHSAYQEVKKQEWSAPIPTVVAAPKKEKKVFNLANDNIEWASYSWNPVTGCEFGCDYCYARDIANRFYSEGFKPTFHEDRLDAPKNTKLAAGTTNNVFVCSMADLFGSWVPDEWIDKVFESIRNNPQWNFILLTKNPDRYLELDIPANCWVGATADTQERAQEAVEVFKKIKNNIRFISCEPLMERIDIDYSAIDWVIIGGRSKNTKLPEFQPEWEWVEKILFDARKAGKSIYFKPNLTVKPKEFPFHRVEVQKEVQKDYRNLVANEDEPEEIEEEANMNKIGTIPKIIQDKIDKAKKQILEFLVEPRTQKEINQRFKSVHCDYALDELKREDKVVTISNENSIKFVKV